MYIIKKVIAAGFLIALVSVCSYAALIDGGIPCLLGQKCCLISGTQTCVDDSEVCIPCSNTSACTEGHHKYTASGCSYTDEVCCADGTWATPGNCPKTCTGTKPSSSQSCQKCGKNGTQTRTVTCNTSTSTPKWEQGPWGSCRISCTPGEISTSCSGTCASPKAFVCNDLGNSFSCSCTNSSDKRPHGVPYCQGVPLMTNESCYHGIWSDTKCSGICCCSGDTPKLMSDGTPGCWGTRSLAKTGERVGWQYSCTCTYGGSGGGFAVAP